jgi:hypothetical protein
MLNQNMAKPLEILINFNLDSIENPLPENNSSQPTPSSNIFYHSPSKNNYNNQNPSHPSLPIPDSIYILNPELPTSLNGGKDS